MRQKSIILLLVLLAGLYTAPGASAQIRRGPKTIVRSGLQEKPDTLARSTDSLAFEVDRLFAGADSDLRTRLSVVDSLPQRLLAADSSALDSIRRSLPASDSMMLAEFDALRLKFSQADSSARHQLAYDTEQALRIDSRLLDSLNALSPMVTADTTQYRKRGFFSDSMSLSKVCWLSTVLPGYGQIYNKQYWKLPILYGTVGAGLALFLHENNKYSPLKAQYDAFVNSGAKRTPEVEELQTRMIRSNTRRQLYLGATIASYIYFIGDAAVKYSTNEVSRVKKATTLACICPGAGQIYNKSYWKVPFVIGGFAALIYVIDWNNRGYQRFKTAYGIKAEWDQADPGTRPSNSPDEFRGRYSTDFLKNLKDSYRRNRDLCIIITAGLYILQIVDAHVDAHLKDYDISDDLSMNIEPLVDYTYVPAQGCNQPVFGFNLRFNF